MRVVMAGSSGFLGQALTGALRAEGHEVVRLVRRAAEGPDEEQWDPYAARLDPAVVEAADVVVNLAGRATAGNPHSKRWAREMHSSRVSTTDTLARAIAASTRKPAFLAQNAVGYYGDHGPEVITEESDSRGDSFLTQVTRAWQHATTPAVDAGARVVVMRTAPVLHRQAAPLQQLLLPFRLGLGRPAGRRPAVLRLRLAARLAGRRDCSWPSTTPRQGRSTCAAPTPPRTPSSPTRSRPPSAARPGWPHPSRCCARPRARWHRSCWAR